MGNPTNSELIEIIKQQDAAIKMLHDAVYNSLAWSNNRQSEWGPRAVHSFEFLETALAYMRSNPLPDTRFILNFHPKDN